MPCCSISSRELAKDQQGKWNREEKTRSWKGKTDCWQIISKPKHAAAHWGTVSYSPGKCVWPWSQTVPSREFLPFSQIQLSMYFCPHLTFFHAHFPLGFFLYNHTSCAQYKCFKTCFSSIDSFQCLGKFGTGEPMVYSSKFTNMSTPPWRDSMFSCQWVYFSFFAFRAGSCLIRKFCVWGRPAAASLLQHVTQIDNFQCSSLFSHK